MMRTSTLIGLRAAQALDDALLQHAQQLDLHLQRQFADLVEEQRRLIGGFEAADLPRQRAGVGAALAAEQLALDQRGGNRGAADADHRPLMTRAEVVNRLREHFLARCRFRRAAGRSRASARPVRPARAPAGCAALSETIGRERRRTFTSRRSSTFSDARRSRKRRISSSAFSSAVWLVGAQTPGSSRHRPVASVE